MALKQEDGHFALCPKQEGVGLNRVCILGIFVVNRVRVLSPRRLTYARVPPGKKTTNTWPEFISYSLTSLVNHDCARNLQIGQSVC